MNAKEFLEFLGKVGSVRSLPKHPMRKQWKKEVDRIRPHYYGEIPDLLCRAFPNEDHEVLEYRKLQYEPVTQSVILQAIDDVYRLLSSSKFSIDFESQRMNEFVNLFKVDGRSFTDYIFQVIYSRRVHDPNALVVWNVEGKGTTDNRTEVMPLAEIVPSCRVIYNDNAELVVYTTENKEEGSGSEKITDLIPDGKVEYKVLTDEFYGTLKHEGKSMVFVLDYIHNLGRLPVVVTGGRPVVMECKKTRREYIVNKSDFTAAIPHLNRYAILDNQDISVTLSTAFPWKFLRGITCKGCNGKGHNLPTVIDQEDPDKRITCKRCKGGGKVFPSSPLHGYYIQELEGATKEERAIHAQQKPIEFYQPDVSILDHICNKKEAARSRAEEVLNVRRQSKVTESGKAKEIDRESLYTQIGKISEYIFGTLIQDSLEIIQGLRFRDLTSQISVNAPTSFDIKTESMLLAEFLESIKGSPANIRHKAFLDFIKRRFHGDKISHRIAELSVMYAPLYLYTIDERAELVGGGGISREESIKATFVFSWLTQIADSVDLITAEKSAIFARLDEMAKPFFATALEKEIDPDSFNIN